MKPLRVLVACEESGVVRRAFRALGHEAWSCDLEPARDDSPFHLQEDARRAIRHPEPDGGDWDLLIAFPPCTYLCNSGVRWFTTPARDSRVATGVARLNLMHEAARLFTDLLTTEIPRVAIENPVMHGYAREFIGDLLFERQHTPIDGTYAAQQYARPTQTIQPWQFGHGEVKRTCLWLRGLPSLRPTTVVDGRVARVHRESPGPLRARDRSVTYEGIAAAMAEQWGRDAVKSAQDGDQ